MITYNALMDLIGSKLTSDLRTYERKIASLREGDEPPQRNGVSIKHILNIPPSIRAIYDEGDDGDSSIDIIMPKSEGMVPLVTLHSYNHRTVNFRLLTGSTFNKTTVFFNAFLPPDYLAHKQYGTMLFGKNLMLSFKANSAKIAFNSKDKLVYALNAEYFNDSPLQKRKYTALTDKITEKFRKQLVISSASTVNLKLKRKVHFIKEVNRDFNRLTDKLLTGNPSFEDMLSYTVSVLGPSAGTGADPMSKFSSALDATRLNLTSKV